MRECIVCKKICLGGIGLEINGKEYVCCSFSCFIKLPKDQQLMKQIHDKIEKESTND